MKNVTLNGLWMTSPEKTHRQLKRRLDLPDYYGGNLDALCDCLSTVSEPTTVTLRFSGAMRKRLGDYGTRLLSVLAACTGENPRLHLVLHERW